MDISILLPYVTAGALPLLGLGLFLVAYRRAPAVHHEPASAHSAPIDLNTALETVLVKAMDSQTTMFERMQRLNMENAQMALDSLQRKRKYGKGGTKRAATAVRKSGKFVTNCRLCQDPMIGDPTVAEIIAHSDHRLRRKEPEPPRQWFEKGKDGEVTAHVDESEILTAPDGSQQIECGDCLQGVPHQHGSDA